MFHVFATIFSNLLESLVLLESFCYMNLQLTHLANKINSQVMCHIFLKRESTVTRITRVANTSFRHFHLPGHKNTYICKNKMQLLNVVLKRRGILFQRLNIFHFF